MIKAYKRCKQKWSKEIPYNHVIDTEKPGLVGDLVPFLMRLEDCVLSEAT
jgi:hypothetical protein